MSRFKRVLEENQEVAKGIPAKEDYSMPIYRFDGKNSRLGKKGAFTKVKTIVVATSLILGILYIPQLFLKDSVESNVISKDITYLNHTLNTKARNNNGNLDYDNDGLTNAQEVELKTNLWDIDTDNDGISDEYESKTDKLSPIKANKYLLDLQKETDKENKEDVSTPYKIGNVILWAEDYESKAYGSVIETITGYRFCNFKGYAQFPDYENITVYKVENGKRTELSFLKKEQAWKIDGDIEVEVYKEPLEEVIRFGLFGNHVYINNNFIFNGIAAILPDKGILTAAKMTSMDVDPDVRNSTTTTIQPIEYDKDDYARLTHNDNSLEELMYVRNAIQDKACVGISLYSHEYGELIAIVYGYTYSGDLLLADAKTLEPIGTLKIDESAKKLLTNDGNIVSYPYFNFSGFGFDSENGDKISFFTASKNAGEYNSHFTEKQDLNYDDVEISDITEESTEIIYFD